MIQMHNKTLNLALFFVLTLLISNEAMAQSGTWKFGFELGWTQSKLTGDVENDGNGLDLESLSYNGGFHLSFYSRRHFTDELGVQIGLSYAQRGVKREFEGPSYYFFGQVGTNSRLLRVNRFESLKIQSGYLDIPVIAFYKIKRFEIGAGVYGAVMLNAKANGELRISPSSSGVDFSPFLVNVEYNYFKDDFGDDPIGVKQITVNNIPYIEPIAMRAYHEYIEDPMENYYNRLDYGLIGQVGVYLNESLNIKGRLMYGLSDLTKKEADFSKFDFESGPNLIQRDDNDRNISIQVSLGFMF